MANKKGNDTVKDVKKAAQTTKKAANTAKKGKKLYKNSGFRRALPYIMIFLAIFLALCFIFINILEKDAIVLRYSQQLFCGLFGGAAYFLPALLFFLGIIWCVIDFKFSAKDNREGSDKAEELIHTRKKTRNKTILTIIAILLFATILGVFEITAEQGWDGDYSYEFDYLWVNAAEDNAFVSGGIIGGSLAFLMALLYPAFSIILLFILFIFVLLFIIGLTPKNIYNKIMYRRELEAQAEEYDEDEEERQLEILKAKELDKMRKKRQKERLAEQRREAKLYAQNYDFSDEDEENEDEENEDFSEEYAVPLAAVKNTEELVDEEKTEEAEEQDDDMDILLDGIGIDDEGYSNSNQAEPEEEIDDTDGLDFGGDDIDGNPSVDDLLDGIGEEDNEDDTPIELNAIAADELSEDMKAIEPEKAEETVQQEIILPYVFPPIEMLSPNKNAADPNVQAELQENAKILKDTLKSFNVQIRDITYSRGPTVTRYELKPEVGTKVKSIANLVDDIALNLATSGVRIEAPIPNKPAVGIEVPNRNPETVYLRELIENPKFTTSKSRVTAALGKDIGGNPICFDVAKMPHLLIAGATGMGKSVCINCIIISLLYKARPEEVKLILIDPKKVEFAMYKDIPHLYAPIVSDPKKATGALASAVVEMERRFELIETAGVRNIEGYNQAIEGDPTKEKLPLIVIIIDELADLMMTAGKDVESCIARLAQKARAAGIHLIIGTQRPSVDVITGLIKANIPSRIACTVASQIDSRTILDMAGAEKLIGRGDMLFAPVGSSKPMRVQGAFVSDSEVENIVTFVKTHNSTARYNADFISSMEANAKNVGAKKGDMSASDDSSEGGSSSSGDSKFDEAVRTAIEAGKVSTSYLQRKLEVGYGRAAKLIDLMEEKGYVGPANGSKPREVLITMTEYMNQKAND